MDTKHTPGPWTWGRFDDEIHIVPDRGEILAKVCFRNETVGTLPVEANAQLMAAAPALLAACQDFVRLSDAMAHEWTQGDWRAVLTCVRDSTEQFRAAIRLATEGK